MGSGAKRGGVRSDDFRVRPERRPHRRPSRPGSRGRRRDRPEQPGHPLEPRGRAALRLVRRGSDRDDVCSVGIAPSEADQATEIFNRILAGESWTGEFPVMTKSGTYKRMHFHAGPVHDNEGNVVGVVSVANDADEMAETAAQLSLFQSALGQSPVGVGMYDEAFNYVRANDALCGIIGLPIEEIRGRRVRDVLGDVLGEQVEGYLARVFQTGEPVVNHEVHGPTPLHPDEDRWYQVSYFRLHDNHGN